MTNAILSLSPSQVESSYNYKCNHGHRCSQNSQCSIDPLERVQSPTTPMAFPSQPSISKDDQRQKFEVDNDCKGAHSSNKNERSPSLSYKTVRFSIQPTIIIPYIHWRDMTEEEIKSGWLTYKDKSRFRREVALTKRLVRQGAIFNENITTYNPDDLSISSSSSESDDDEKEIELCYRGLEGRRHHLIATTRRVVLSVQEYHRAMQQDYLEHGFVYDSDDSDDDLDKASENYLEYENMIRLEHLTIANEYKNTNQDAAILARERGRQDFNELLRC